MDRIGMIEDRYEEKEFEWRIKEFSSVKTALQVFESPTFSFSATLFYVRLYLKSNDKRGYSFFCLHRTNSLEPVKYDISLKNHHGNDEEVAKGVLENKNDSGIIYFKTSIFDTLDTLSIVCRLQRGKPNFYQSNSLNVPKPMEMTRLDTLSENFRNLLLNKENCDVILRVNNIEFYAHKAVLIARSPVFAAMFRHNTSEKQTGIVNIPDCDPDSFHEFLEFLYCGKLNDISFQSAYHLYSTSDKYEILDFKCFCVEYIKRNLGKDTWYHVVQLADEHRDENLQNAVQNFFNKNVSTILDTPGWEHLVKSNYHLANRLLKGMASKIIIKD